MNARAARVTFRPLRARQLTDWRERVIVTELRAENPGLVRYHQFANSRVWIDDTSRQLWRDPIRLVAACQVSRTSSLRGAVVRVEELRLHSITIVGVVVIGVAFAVARDGYRAWVDEW